MKDRIVEHPKRYQLKKVEGQLDQYDLISAPGAITEIGTPINKATLLQDSVYSKYASASSGLPSSSLATPNDVFDVLTRAYANSIQVILTDGVRQESGKTDNSGFSRFENIAYDATGKCTLDTSSKYCTRVYIPKGIKRVLIQTKLEIRMASGERTIPVASIYKNGSNVQSIYIGDDEFDNDGNYYYTITDTVIDTDGTGTEYIQIYFYLPAGIYINARSLQCQYMRVQMLDF